MASNDAPTLQLSSTLSQHVRKVFQVIAGGDPELPYEIPRSALQISVVTIFVCLWDVILGSPEISITAYRAGAFKALETLLGFGLSGWVEVIATEEFIGRYAFLGAEFLAGVFLVIV